MLGINIGELISTMLMFRILGPLLSSFGSMGAPVSSGGGFGIGSILSAQANGTLSTAATTASTALAAAGALPGTTTAELQAKQTAVVAALSPFISAVGSAAASERTGAIVEAAQSDSSSAAWILLAA